MLAAVDLQGRFPCGLQVVSGRRLVFLCLVEPNTFSILDIRLRRSSALQTITMLQSTLVTKMSNSAWWCDLPSMVEGILISGKLIRWSSSYRGTYSSVAKSSVLRGTPSVFITLGRVLRYFALLSPCWKPGFPDTIIRHLATKVCTLTLHGFESSVSSIEGINIPWYEFHNLPFHSDYSSHTKKVLPT